MSKVIVFSAPSGSGKSSIIKKVLEHNHDFMFAVSACSRGKRPGETDGLDYHFLPIEEFKSKIRQDEFVEWEEVYAGQFYGTLKSEITRIFNLKKNVIFDLDVKGGLKIKSYFKEQALSIFIMPPSIETLHERLLLRGTETDETLQKRLARASMELNFAKQFDCQIINDKLDKAVEETLGAIDNFLHC